MADEIMSDKSELADMLAACSSLERQFQQAINVYPQGHTRQWKELQFCIAREAIGVCLDGVTLKRREKDSTLEFHSAKILERITGISGGTVELKLYSRGCKRYEMTTIPYCDKDGFSYGVWADRLRQLEQWFDVQGDSSTDDLNEPDKTDAEEEAAFMATLRPHDNYFERFYMGTEGDNEVTHDTLDRLNL
jgi:hypothetical protein